ncbi:hypothetical protein D9M70_485200 [compost metagenome]
MRLVGRQPRHPIGQFVGVAVAGIEEAALLQHQLQRIGRRLALVDAERALAGQFRMQTDDFADMLALDLLRKILVFQPAQAVAGDFPAGFLHGRNRFRIARHGERHAVDRQRNVTAREHAPQPPETGACAIFVDRFHVEITLSLPGLRADDLGQQTFGRRVAIENAALAALLVVQHELHGNARIARPVCLRRIAAVANEVARILSLRHQITLRFFQNGITADRIVDTEMT